MTDKDDRYPIGYKKPPKAHRFKAGCSGNPQGRPRKFPDLLHQLERVYTDDIPFQDGKKRRSAPGVVVVARKQMEAALKGNSKAMEAVLRHAWTLGVDRDHILAGWETNCKLLTDEELAELLRLIKKLEEGDAGSKTQ